MNAATNRSNEITATQSEIDFTVQNEDRIFLLHPHSESARAWVEEHIGRDNGFQPYWPSVVVEHRFIRDVIDGTCNDGLGVH